MIAFVEGEDLYSQVRVDYHQVALKWLKKLFYAFLIGNRQHGLFVASTNKVQRARATDCTSRSMQTICNAPLV